MRLLVDLARTGGVESGRDAMFRGEHDQRHRGPRRAAHRAAAADGQRSLVVDGKNVMPEVNEVLDRMAAFAERRPLGPDRRDGRQALHRRRQHRHRRLATSARRWRRWRWRPTTTGRAALRLQRRRRADPRHAAPASTRQRTLFIVASKTFTTIETMTNARTARAWLQATLGEEGAARISPPSRPRSTRPPPSASTPIASSASGTGSAAAIRSGSAIGLPVMIAIGPERLPRVPRRRARDGPAFPARRRCARTCRCCSALVGIWHRNVMGYPTRAVLPYDQRLLPAAGLPAAARHGIERQAGRRSTARPSPAPPARSSGASPAPTASTPSTS